MLIHPMPDPTIIAIGPFAIQWYGLMYLTGFLLFIIFGRIRIRQPHLAAAGWTPKHLEDMLFYGVLGVIIGARLGEVIFYHPAYFLAHPWEIFAIWKGGMSYHGGMLGVVFAAWIYGLRNGRGFLEVVDLVTPLVCFGYIAGRIGNFINAELHGKVASATLPWAMIWPNVDLLPRHPSPLYQAFFDGFVVLVLLWIYARKQRPPGAVAAMYLVLYGVCRIFTEHFRVPDYEISLAFLSVSSGQLLSIPMIMVGATYLVFIYRKTARQGHL